MTSLFAVKNYAFQQTTFLGVGLVRLTAKPQYLLLHHGKNFFLFYFFSTSSSSSTEYPVNPVLDAYGPMISTMQKTRTESRNPVLKMEFTV